MKLRMALEDKEMDVRLRDRLVADGKVQASTVTTYLNSLPDEEGNYINLTDNSGTVTSDEEAEEIGSTEQ